LSENKNYVGSETTPYINKEKGDTLAPPRKKEVRFRREASRPLLQT